MHCFIIGKSRGSFLNPTYKTGAHRIAYPEYIEDMTPEQREVMEAPHIRH